MLQATADLVLLKSRKGNIEDSIHHWQTGNNPGPIKVQGENRCLFLAFRVVTHNPNYPKCRLYYFIESCISQNVSYFRIYLITQSHTSI